MTSAQNVDSLDELISRAEIVVACPACAATFPATEAQLFDATSTLVGPPLAKLNALRDGLVQERLAHELRIAQLRRRSKTAARSVNIGKVVEKIAPSLEGFPANPDECRSLFEPIDYLVFHGVSRGRIESVTFVDLKSGRAVLSRRQREIRQAVQTGKVTLHVIERERT